MCWRPGGEDTGRWKVCSGSGDMVGEGFVGAGAIQRCEVVD